MIVRKKEDIFKVEADAFVCPVSLCGIHGYGLQRDFSRKFPAFGLNHKSSCLFKQAKSGKVLVYDFSNPPIYPCRYIISLPTRTKWCNLSNIEFIENGMKSLVKAVKKYSFKSIVIPALGCGSGSLPWEQVGPIIEKYAGQMKNIDVIILEPL